MMQFTLNDLTPRQLDFIEKAATILLASPFSIAGYIESQNNDEESVLMREAALRARNQLNSRFDDPEFIAQADRIIEEDARDTVDALKTQDEFSGFPVDWHLDLFISCPESIDLNPKPKADPAGGLFGDMLGVAIAELGLERCEQVAAARAVKAIQAGRSNMPEGATGMPTLHDFRYTDSDMFECHRCGETVDYKGKQHKIAAGELCVTMHKLADGSDAAEYHGKSSIRFE